MTRIWAHRGASAQAPENTLPAFALAAEQGADGVELDVQMSADGELVVIHDETIDRTSTGSGRVKDLSLAELRRHDYSAGKDGYSDTAIPTLREVYELLGPKGLHVNVELKNTIEPYPDLEEAVEALTATMNMAGQVTYSSFNHQSLASITRAGTQVPTAVLHSDMLYEPWNYAQSFGASALHPHWGLVLRTPGYVEQAHGVGLDVNVWTANEPVHLTLMFEQGVDAVITDWPERALELRP